MIEEAHDIEYTEPGIQFLSYIFYRLWIQILILESSQVHQKTDKQ